VAAALSLTLGFSTLSPQSAQASRDVVTVTIPLTTIDTPGRTGSSALLHMRLGNSAPITVMIDTGTVGLRLWGTAPEGAKVTQERISTRLGGQRVPGVIATAPMHFLGVSTVRNVPFQYISTDNAYIKRWKKAGVSGIIGLGVGGGDLTNPLMSLPANLGQSWSLSFSRRQDAGRLVIGDLPRPDSLMRFTLPSQGKNIYGHSIWNDKAANGCWAFARAVRTCVPTWFDSGFTVMRVKGRQFSVLPTTSTGRLKNGTEVQLAAGSSAFYGYNFTAGNIGSRSIVKVVPRSSPVINTGNAIFFRYTVTYATTTGDIYLSTRSSRGN
jgi:hypothetical protein